ncbi:MAG: serine hydrolase [Deltaproteobacteria bacterium]|nr:MAG: serine hydrolase [Deltaproteobacteria bacterium]
MSGKERILQLLNDGVTEGVFPGAVLLVARRKQNLFLESVGHAALLPKPRPMTRNTHFDLASLTKPLATSLSVFYLVSQKKLRLDASLVELLPSTRVPVDKQNITLAQLLCHCSGLPSWRPYYLSLGKWSPNTCKAQLRSQILQETLECAPGARTIYSDLGFLLVEWIVEEKSGQDLHNFSREHIFGQIGCDTLGYLPLGQARASRPHNFAATENCPWRGRILIGEVHDENAFIVGGVAGHAGLFGTASEVKCVLDSILDTLASGHSPRLWSREDLARFLSPIRLEPTSAWALGFDTPASTDSSAGRYFSNKTVGHLGYTGTSFWLDIEREIAVVFLTNRIHPSRTNERIREFRPLIHDAVMEEFG